MNFEERKILASAINLLECAFLLLNKLKNYKLKWGPIEYTDGIIYYAKITSPDGTYKYTVSEVGAIEALKELLIAIKIDEEDEG